MVWDLSSGRRLATASTLNPQVQYGADVMTRITAAAENSAGLSRLRDCIIECVNQLILEAAQSAAVSKDAIYDLVFVGNPSMQHLFFGIQPAGIGLAPYQPILRSDMLYRAVDIGLTVNAAAQLYWLPGVSGFVGADTIGMLISQPIDDAEQVTIALDIGTNGEMVLAWKDELWACSTAAGPAFEGACMACGMRAQPGAIDKVIINGDGVQYRVIGNVLPRGICGSGIINAIAAMINAGLIDKSGRLLEPADTNPLRELVVKRAGRGAFLLVAADQTADGKEIVITQEDIRQLQLAKAAIVSGLKMMLKQAGIDVPAVTKVVFAGAFGLFLTSENVGTIGLLPESLCDKIVYVGNAAGFGAENALLSKQMRQVAGEIAKRVNYVELAGRPEFSDIFIGELYFSAVKAQ